MAHQPLTQLKYDRYGVFAGTIDAGAVQRITMQLGSLTDPRSLTGRVHLCLHSAGGEIADGVALHNFFKAFPLELVVYNPGTVASAAVLAFLGAADRRASRHATFAMHRSFVTLPGRTPATDLQKLVDMLVIDDDRTQAIFHEAGSS